MSISILLAFFLGLGIAQVTGLPNIDSAVEYSHRRLTSAILSNDLNKFERAVAELNADGLNVRLEDGSTHLITAALHGREVLVRRLLEAGADPNSKSKADGQTALMRAAMFRRLDVLKELMQARWKAEANAVDDHGMTALMYATASSIGHDGVPGNSGAIQALLRGGADPTVEQKETGFTALIFAVTARAGMEEIRALVEDRALRPEIRQRVLDHQDDDGRTALMWAAQSNLNEVKEYLIRQGASTKLKDSRGLTVEAYEKIASHDSSEL